MQNLEKIVESWDQEKKRNLVSLGNSTKTYSECLLYLENEIATSQRMTDFIYKIPCFMNDGIYQLHRAIEENIGATNVQKEHAPSSDRERPISTLDIILADGTRKKIPYGEIDLPGMGEGASIDIFYSENGKYLSVKGTCQFKFQTLIDKIISRTNELLKTDSIYKSQAIEINANVNKGQPEILDLSNIDKEVMILSEETEYELSPLYSRILQPENCIKNNISIKYGAILEGPYGGFMI